ncbi:MAG: HAMP domain-containing protein, partial [Candidatus Methylomirabilales bacterium]
MESSSTPKKSPKVYSISRRFSYALVGVVTLLLVAFASVAIFINITRLNTELENRLDNALHLARISLPKPLWNLDGDIVADFVKSLFLDESVVFARALWTHQVVSTRARKDFEGKDFSYFERSPEFAARASEILFEGSKVGTIQIAVSREKIRKELVWNISGIVALTLLMIGAISLTSILITRRYIARPLLKLQDSATQIAQGDLEASIDTASADEI